MQRRWQAEPDRQLPDGTLVISAAAIVQLCAEAGQVVARIGGTFSVLQNRVDGELPGEMLTTKFIVIFYDRTDAKPQPEVANELAELEAQIPEPTSETPLPEHVEIPDDEPVLDAAGEPVEYTEIPVAHAAEPAAIAVLTGG